MQRKEVKMTERLIYIGSDMSNRARELGHPISPEFVRRELPDRIDAPQQLKAPAFHVGKLEVFEKQEPKP